MPSNQSIEAISSDRRGLGAAGLVLGSVLSVQLGQAFGKSLFEQVTPAGVIMLRLGFAALIFVALMRPRMPGNWVQGLSIAAFGTAIAGMNLIYFALPFLPIGIAAAIQLTGPIAVALLTSRRTLDVVWALIAVFGLILAANPMQSAGEIEPEGLAFAIAAAISMGSYNLLSQRVGRFRADRSDLSLAVCVAAFWYTPFGVDCLANSGLDAEILLSGLGVALLSAVIPYSLELSALRRLPVRIVGILQSLEPVAGAIAGLLVLGELLSFTQWLAVAFITGSSIGVLYTGRNSIG